MDKPKEGKMVCRCPYCEVTINPESVICVACQMVIIDCAQCGKPVRDNLDECPHCGGKVK